MTVIERDGATPSIDNYYSDLCHEAIECAAPRCFAFLIQSKASLASFAFGKAISKCLDEAEAERPELLSRRKELLKVALHSAKTTGDYDRVLSVELQESTFLVSALKQVDNELVTLLTEPMLDSKYVIQSSAGTSFGHWLVRMGSELQAATKLLVLLAGVRQTELRKLMFHRDGHGNTAFHLLCLSSGPHVLEVAGVLLSLAKTEHILYVRNNSGSTPLHALAKKGTTQLLEVFLHGVEALNETEDEEGLTPLHLAVLRAKRGDADVARILLEHGCNARRTNSDGISPLYSALLGNLQLSDFGLDTILEEALRLDDDTLAGFPVHALVYSDSIQLLKRAMECGFDPNVHRPANLTAPLHIAQSAKAVEILCEYGADISATDARKNTPMHRACIQRRPAVVAALISKGATYLQQHLNAEQKTARACADAECLAVIAHDIEEKKLKRKQQLSSLRKDEYSSSESKLRHMSDSDLLSQIATSILKKSKKQVVVDDPLPRSSMPSPIRTKAIGNEFNFDSAKFTVHMTLDAVESLFLLELKERVMLLRNLNVLAFGRWTQIQHTPHGGGLCVSVDDGENVRLIWQTLQSEGLIKVWACGVMGNRKLKKLVANALQIIDSNAGGARAKLDVETGFLARKWFALEDTLVQEALKGERTIPKVDDNFVLDAHEQELVYRKDNAPMLIIGKVNCGA